MNNYFEMIFVDPNQIYYNKYAVYTFDKRIIMSPGVAVLCKLFLQYYKLRYIPTEAKLWHCEIYLNLGI